MRVLFFGIRVKRIAMLVAFNTPKVEQDRSKDNRNTKNIYPQKKNGYLFAEKNYLPAQNLNTLPAC
ncbi:hypothetical protein BZG01_19080 [Labilibaculum manganireducens]|uniref:Uncharacterized protein n=1 Tax=Labilibaculum manganireducens TaxID=1940525 RepID=A0A2N3HTV0_9BACT|nr:hypothetical protein BZG01_19080 [Labilibaculum manganireducens]